MTEGRALLTPRERDILSGNADVKDNYRYKVESHARKRIREHLSEDLEVLEDNYPEIYSDIQEMICDGE